MKVKPLTGAAYRPYGAVVAAFAGDKPKKANMGTAKRWDWLAPLENKRKSSKANLSVFRCKPFKGRIFPVKLLERHEFSTQVFIPLSPGAKCLIVVAKGGKKPDLSTLKAFVLRSGQGIAYKPGTWHHPMVALGKPVTLACLVHEDGTQRDCEVRPLPKTINIRL